MATVLVLEYRIKTTWESDDTATPQLIEPLLDDMGDPEPLRSILRNQANEILSWGEITMGELNVMLNCFVEGYLFATQTP